MTDRRFVFVDIDTQRDFLDPDGALFVPRSGEILENLRKLTETAREFSIPVIATSCAHRLDESDPDPFPPHCLVDTPGQDRSLATAWPGGLVFGPLEAFRCETDALPPHLTLEKTRYDVFSRPDADRVVEHYARDRPVFIVYGVATDYCVRAAVLGLLERGQQVRVVTDAVRAVDISAEADVLTDLIRQGAALTLTDLVIACVRESD